MKHINDMNGDIRIYMTCQEVIDIHKEKKKLYGAIARNDFNNPDFKPYLSVIYQAKDKILENDVLVAFPYDFVIAAGLDNFENLIHNPVKLIEITRSISDLTENYKQ